MMLEPAIEMAATSGRRRRPSGSKAPAAIGSASELQPTAYQRFGSGTPRWVGGLPARLRTGARFIE